MQLSDMQARVSARLNEGVTGPTFYPVAEITAALNEAERFFILLTLGLEVTAAWNLPGGTTFYHMLDYFTDWIVPLRITTATGAKVRPARLEDLASLDSQWMSSQGTPLRYVALGADLVALYQQPGTLGTTLNVTYARAPAPLVHATDVPESPAEYHARLVEYGIYRCRQVEGGQEFAKALPLLQAFLDGAKHYAAYVRARNLGSRYDKVPFELENFDASQLLKLRRDLVPSRRPSGE